MKHKILAAMLATSLLLLSGCGQTPSQSTADAETAQMSGDVQPDADLLTRIQ